MQESGPSGYTRRMPSPKKPTRKSVSKPSPGKLSKRSLSRQTVFVVYAFYGPLFVGSTRARARAFIRAETHPSDYAIERLTVDVYA